MKKKQVTFSESAREALSNGVTILSNAVGSTLGPNGRTVIIQQPHGDPSSTKDGVTVAKSIALKDELENMGVQLVRQASVKTADQAGDGTSTSTVLAAEIFNAGLEALSEHNSVDIKRGVDLGVKDAVEYLQEMSKEITDESQLEQIATISANNDEEVGKLIATAMDKVGQDGVITIEESRTGDTYLETVEGMQFSRGYKSPYFVTDNKTMSTTLEKPLIDNKTMSTTLEKPLILITEERLTKAKDLLPLLEACSSQNKSLVIIADDIDGEALSTLVVNKMRGILNVVAVKAPEYGDRKKDALSDIAVLTGGQVITKEKGMRLDRMDMEWLGRARKVTVGKEDTTIVDGGGTEESIIERVETIKALIDDSSSPFEIEKLQERLGRLVGGVGVLHVGGHTELEMKEKKDRVEDALHATRAALEEGILPGGGVALVRAQQALEEKVETMEFSHPDQRVGYLLLTQCLNTPFKLILNNAFGDKLSIAFKQQSIIEEDNLWYGYNPRTEVFVDMYDAGIIDPAKVTRLALENAASVAGTMLTTEAVISNLEQEGQTDNTDNLMLG
jgi:chaperonin GroEL